MSVHERSARIKRRTRRIPRWAGIKIASETRRIGQHIARLRAKGPSSGEPARPADCHCRVHRPKRDVAAGRFLISSAIRPRSGARSTVPRRLSRIGRRAKVKAASSGDPASASAIELLRPPSPTFFQRGWHDQTNQTDGNSPAQETPTFGARAICASQSAIYFSSADQSGGFSSRSRINDTAGPIKCKGKGDDNDSRIPLFCIIVTRLRTNRVTSRGIRATAKLSLLPLASCLISRHRPFD